MARQLKPQIVDEVSSPNGLVTCPVYFDRNEKDFYVEVTGLDDRVRADSVHEVKQKAKELLAKAIAFKWDGIIIIDLAGSYDEEHKQGSISYHGHQFGASIEFTFDRLERSVHPTKPDSFVYREHAIDFESDEPADWQRKERERNENFKHHYVNELNSVVLPYDEETWAGLHALKQSVDAAHARLVSLAKRKDFAAKLRLTGKQSPIPILPEAVGEAKGRR